MSEWDNISISVKFGNVRMEFFQLLVVILGFS